MKTAAPLLILLICFSDALTPPITGPCCASVSNGGIRIQKVATARFSSILCTVRALIVRDTSGEDFCINPECPWAKRNAGILGEKMNKKK